MNLFSLFKAPKYTKMLIELKKLLKKNGFSFTQKGEGKSIFLYIKGNSASAEVSPDSNGLWIELWESIDEQSYDEPVKKITCTTVEDAYQVLSSRIK